MRTISLCLAAALPAMISTSCTRSAVPQTRLASSVPTVTSEGPKQILFGDLHVHSTYSVDAFVMNLPVMSGEGVRPLEEACDYARYCSGLDFWATTDHAESMSPQTWRKVRSQMRACDAAESADGQPQTVVFTGFEWTQFGLTPETQYGHKNVIFKNLADELLPPRPIAMGAFPVQKGPGKWDPAAALYLLAIAEILEPMPYAELSAYIQGLQNMKVCPAGVDTRKLSPNCMEIAPDSATLFEKLRQGGHESLVIPHGNAWGLHVPMLSDFATQLGGNNHDPQRQRLIEIYSGHGSSEQWRPFNEPVLDEGGAKVCPAPTDGYLPCCWRAGEIVRERCENSSSEACAAQVAAARERYVDAGLQGFRTVAGAGPEDWLSCGQCSDCFMPAFNYRPNSTAQRALAVANFDQEDPKRFRFGFIGSSDTHKSAPGAGVKEDRSLADGAFPRNSLIRAAYVGGLAAIDWEFERQSSFWYTGGLAAVHASSKTRDGIWDALQRRETYATSGPRILLWFNLMNDDSGFEVPMGGEGAVSGMPRFEVRAVGAYEQKPGCPADRLDGGTAEARERICRGVCYNPTDKRIPISRIEVVKIRPQSSAGEPMADLIQDPFKVFECQDEGKGCRHEFEDPDFITDGRQALYYVRAVQQATPAVNAGTLRCEYDDAGKCVKVNPCWGDYRTEKSDQCFSPADERAWSSPIFVEPRAVVVRQ